MWKKQYPSVIVLRKEIIAVVVLVGVLFAVLLFYNLSTKQTYPRSQTNHTLALSTKADIVWVKKAAANAPKPKPVATASMEKPVNSNAMPVLPLKVPPDTNFNPAHPQSNHLQRAMSAPIGSNQLLAPVTQAVTGVTGTTPAGTAALQDGKGFLNHSQSGSDYLGTHLKNPVSPYEIQAGTILPGILVSGINSDLPGQIIGQIRENVYDSIAGRYMLIPQGARLVGRYDSQVIYGQSRVLIAWERIIFPNGQSIDLRGMPGADLSGYAGFHDLVNNHYLKIFGSVVLMSVLSAGAQLSQPQQSNSPFAGPTVSQTIAQSLGQNIANTGTMMVQKDLNIAPTLEIRPGYEFNVMVTKDLVFPGPYPSTQGAA